LYSHDDLLALQIQTEITGEELCAAEPDMLRNDLDELIKTWNE